MTQFITWPKTIDIKFRAAYLTKTGEKIQSNPLQSEDDLLYLVGSSRVSTKQLDELKADTNITTKTDDIKTTKDTRPIGWISKTE